MLLFLSWTLGSKFTWLFLWCSCFRGSSAAASSGEVAGEGGEGGEEDDQVLVISYDRSIGC